MNIGPRGGMYRLRGTCASRGRERWGDENIEESDQETVNVETLSNIEETETSVKLQMDVAGFQLNQISVKLERVAVLAVSGARTNNFGHTIRFSHRFALDETSVDMNHLTASLSGGVLTISIPKKEREDESPREIPIMSTEPQREIADESMVLPTTSEKMNDEEEAIAVAMEELSVAGTVNDANQVRERENQKSEN